MKEEELKEWNIIDDFNKFILKWCKENYIGHLLDDDENDGEDFRDKLRKIQEGRQSKLKDELEFLKKIKEILRGVGDIGMLNNKIKMIEKELRVRVEE